MDGVTWTPRNPESGSTDSLDLHSVTWSGNQFVAVGDNGVILSSVDGIVWTLRASDANIELYGAAWGNGQFLAVGYENQSPNAVGVSNVILSSSDGVTWTPHQASDLLYGVTWGNGQFIAVGMRGAILTSLDGLTWASHEAGTGDSLQSVAWNGRHWIAVGGEIILRSNCSDELPLVITAYEFTRVFPTGEEIFSRLLEKKLLTFSRERILTGLQRAIPLKFIRWKAHPLGRLRSCVSMEGPNRMARAIPPAFSIRPTSMRPKDSWKTLLGCVQMAMDIVMVQMRRGVTREKPIG